jgi:hypothetical protein
MVTTLQRIKQEALEKNFILNTRLKEPIWIYLKGLVLIL